MADLTADRLREVLDYDPLTGMWAWKVRLGSRTKVGVWFSGAKSSSGHLLIRVDRKLYLAHRLAHLWMAGEWPTHEMDHRRGDRTDNRWAKTPPAV